MVRIIETNVKLNDFGSQILDHQSRIIEANSWDEYVKAFTDYDNGTVEFKCETTMVGVTLPRFSKIKDLFYDSNHLTCTVTLPNGLYKKLAYLVEDKR